MVQWLARLPGTQKIRGSSPGRGMTDFCTSIFICLYLVRSSLEDAPTTYDATIFSLRKVSLFPVYIRPTRDVQTWSFKYKDSIGEGEIRLCLCPIQVTPFIYVG